MRRGVQCEAASSSTNSTPPTWTDMLPRQSLLHIPMPLPHFWLEPRASTSTLARALCEASSGRAWRKRGRRNRSAESGGHASASASADELAPVLVVVEAAKEGVLDLGRLREAPAQELAQLLLAAREPGRDASANVDHRRLLPARHPARHRHVGGERDGVRAGGADDPHWRWHRVRAHAQREAAAQVPVLAPPAADQDPKLPLSPLPQRQGPARVHLRWRWRWHGRRFRRSGFASLSSSTRARSLPRRARAPVLMYLLVVRARSGAVAWGCGASSDAGACRSRLAACCSCWKRRPRTGRRASSGLARFSSTLFCLPTDPRN